MSYQRPHDTYIHSNGSEFDARYQPGAYQDEPVNAGDYYRNTDSPYKQESQYEMEPHGNYGQYPTSQGAPYKDYSSSRQNLAGGPAAPGEYPFLAPTASWQNESRN